MHPRCSGNWADAPSCCAMLAFSVHSWASQQDFCWNPNLVSHTNAWLIGTYLDPCPNAHSRWHSALTSQLHFSSGSLPSPNTYCFPEGSRPFLVSFAHSVLSQFVFQTSIPRGPAHTKIWMWRCNSIKMPFLLCDLINGRITGVH